MPTDSNGNYSLPNGYLAIDGATIQPSQHNPPLEDIGNALSQRISRNGSAPMSAPLKHADGVVGNPALTFNSDPSSGFYKTTNGFAVAVGGVKVAEFLAGGVIGARFLGELIPFTCTAAPALCVIPFGQNLTRSVYPALWAQAQIEIAAGNIFYNNGDGSTTFGIGDVRGRLPACWDSAGGTPANRLTTAGSSVNGAILGTPGGGETQTLTLGQLPTGITSSANNTISVTSGANVGQGGTLDLCSGTGATFQRGPSLAPLVSSGVNMINVTSNNTGGAAHPNVQPIIVTNYILFAGA